MRFADAAYPLSELTREVIAGFYRTYDTFGYGFLESPYKRALVLELQHAGLTVEREVPLRVVPPRSIDRRLSRRPDRQLEPDRRGENGAGACTRGDSATAQLLECDEAASWSGALLWTQAKDQASHP